MPLNSELKRKLLKDEDINVKNVMDMFLDVQDKFRQVKQDMLVLNEQGNLVLPGGLIIEGVEEITPEPSPSPGSGGAMAYKSLVALAQAEGDLHLSNASWGISRAHITQIRVETSSTDWDLWILQNDNGYAVNDAVIPRLQLMGNGSGNLTLENDFDYEDEDATDEVHLYFLDNSGSNTANIYIIGQELI